MKYRIFPQEVLKITACVTMLLDHMGYLLFPGVSWLRCVGRIAFPLYCFLLVQGIRHTRSKPKYLLRLLFIALLSELPFDYMISGGFSMAKQSVMLTLLAGALMCIIMEQVPRWLEKPLQSVPAWVHSALALFIKLLVFYVLYRLSPYLRADYGGRGLAIIAMFMLTEDIPYKNLLRLVCLTYLSYIAGGSPVPFLGLQIPWNMFAILAMVPIALYSEKKLIRSPAFNWCFNLFYPAHMALLILICIALSR